MRIDQLMDFTHSFCFWHSGGTRLIPLYGVGYNSSKFRVKVLELCHLLVPLLYWRVSALCPFLSTMVPNASRGFHSTGVRRMGAHAHDEPYYVHAKHMYNLHRMKHQQLKVSLAVLAAVATGVGVPVYAVVFQQKKTASG
ncbi:unnamed protein product [Urochloa decumbens]|uniref:SLL1 protein n=1 Tax=Urochloa decumbens TaxID=240449 RepID=A0ABC9EGM5_9POAL